MQFFYFILIIINYYKSDSNDEKQSIEGRNQFAMLTIDDLVSKDHLVRKINAAIQFDFIYPIVGSAYSTYSRPSIDPVVLIKLVFIQYLFGIRSMR